MDLILSRQRLREDKSPRPDPASFYVSLSPISFDSAESLHEKFKTYTQRKKKLGSGCADSSSANKSYIGNNLSRASFEQQRSELCNRHSVTKKLIAV